MFSRPAMPWAQPHPVSIVTKEGIEPIEKYFISGRYGGEEEMSGFPLQVGSLPHPEAGDLLAFHNAGAYGAVIGMMYRASGHHIPKEITYFNGKFNVHEIDFHH